MGLDGTRSDDQAGTANSVLRVESVCKAFGTNRANDGIDAEFHGGQIHALLGENGAGKSTLIKILCGVYHPDGGSIHLNGAPLHPDSSADARQRGIAVVHQQSALIPQLTVLENLRLVGPITDSTGEDLRQFRGLSGVLGFSDDYSCRVDTLTTGERQRVEIAREMIGNPKVLILDEPTATLAPVERAGLFDVMRRLADSGTAVILVTHRLEEATKYCDAVTILRAGRSVYTHAKPADLAKADLVREMVGEIRIPQREHTRSFAGPPLLVVKGVRQPGQISGREVSVENVEVHSSEILGIAGVEGNGQSDLAALLAGEASCRSVYLAGTTVSGLKPSERVHRVAHVPDDETLGYSANLTVWENMFAEQMLYRQPRSLKAQRRMRQEAAELAVKYNVQPPRVEAFGGQLSGGNKRRVQIAREFTKGAQLVVCNYATRGLDVRSIEQVKTWCRELADRGAAVVYIASDLDEILDVADSVAVLARGRLTQSRPVSEANAQWIGNSMLATTSDDVEEV